MISLKVCVCVCASQRKVNFRTTYRSLKTNIFRIKVTANCVLCGTTSNPLLLHLMTGYGIDFEPAVKVRYCGQ